MSLTQVQTGMISGVPIQVSTNGAITTVSSNNASAITLDGAQNATFTNAVKTSTITTTAGNNGALAVNASTTFNNNISAPNTFGFKNRIINGNMAIDQRNSGSLINPAVNGSYCVDRWTTRTSQTTYYKIQQNAGSVTPPPGFSNYLGVTSLNSSSLGSTDYAFIAQYIEGLNCQDLNWGTSNAKTITLSFWVQSSLTGTFGGAIRNYQNSSNGCYVFSYNIPVSNTWTYVSVTIPGPTTGGSSQWPTTNSGFLELDFTFGVGATYSGSPGSWLLSNNIAPTGAVSVVGTSGATFYITGVQLEVGTQATSFDYRPYGTELALCQRYFTQLTAGSGAYTGFGAGVWGGTSQGNIYLKYPTSMRTSPTFNYSNVCVSDGVNNLSVTSVTNFFGGSDSGLVTLAVSGSTTQYRGAYLSANNNTSAYINFSAEL